MNQRAYPSMEIKRLPQYGYIRPRNRGLQWLCACILPLLLFNCNTLKLRKSDRYHMEAAQAMGYQTVIKYFRMDKQKIRCLVTGNPDGQNLLLVHGSPSSLSAWTALYKDSIFMKTYRMIAVDRPGYGYSNFGKVETSISKQARLIEAVMDSLAVTRTILLGSSYGGPVAAQVAMDRPQQIEHLVFLSASVEPAAEKTFGISHLMIAPVISYVFPAIFRMSSKEKFSHVAELSRIKNWDSIQAPTSIIHGDKDRLVYFSNAAYLQEKIPGAQLFVMKDKGHSIIFTEPEYLKRLLLKVLGAVPGS